MALFHRLAFGLLLLAPLASSGCTSMETGAGPSLAMAPEPAVATVALPETVSVLPAPSVAYAAVDTETPLAQAAVEPAVAPASAPDIAVPAPDAGPVTVAAEQPLEGSEPEADPPLKVAALAEEAVAPVKSLARSAIAMTGLERPRGELDRLIEKYAEFYDVPVVLVRRVVKRESNFRPDAYNRGHWGLMQIKHATARGMGYRGPARGLLDAETNLKYAVKYLRGAYLVADGDHDRADRLYQRGYYYDAKRKGLLEETGLGKDRRRRRS